MCHFEALAYIGRRTILTRGGCLEWNGLRDKDGYGRASWQKQAWRAHRLIIVALGGYIPNDAVVMHICDNPPCCNPRHLKIGSDTENKRDAMDKGRLRWNKRSESILRGETHGRAKLSEKQVRDIALSSSSGAELSRLYGVTPTTICSIRKGRLWPHLGLADRAVAQ